MKYIQKTLAVIFTVLGIAAIVAAVPPFGVPDPKLFFSGGTLLAASIILWYVD